MEPSMAAAAMLFVLVATVSVWQPRLRPIPPLNADAAAGPEGSWRRWWPPRRRRRTIKLDISHVVGEVSARLRTGVSSPRAWQATLERAGITSTSLSNDGGPQVFHTLATHGPRRTAVGRPTVDQSSRAALPSVIAACRLSSQTGAPLAEVLDHCADGISDAARAHAARTVAMTGARTTARLLAWLPALGILLGIAVGADPIGTLLDGGWGTTCLIAASGLMVVGRRWVRRLQRAALNSSAAP